MTEKSKFLKRDFKKIGLFSSFDKKIDGRGEIISNTTDKIEPKKEIQAATNNTDSRLENLWQRISLRIKFNIGEAKFNGWIKPLKLNSIEGSVADITAPSRFIKEWVKSQYEDEIIAHFKAENINIYRIDININANTKKDTSRFDEIKNNSKTETVKEDKFLNIEYFTPREKYSFDNYILNHTNNLALTACKNIVLQKIDNKEKFYNNYNPLFLYGTVGIGKTHLLHAIANEIKKNSGANYAGKKILYLSAEKFMFYFIKSIQNKELINFKEYFRNLDVLMIDDFQFICGKKGTQDELFHTFNSLIDSNCQIIIAADRYPQHFENISNCMKSRISGGLVIDIQPADKDLKEKFVERKLIENNFSNLPDLAEITKYISSQVKGNIREIEGAINKIMMHCQFSQKSLTLHCVKKMLRDQISVNNQEITISLIKKKVADYFCINSSDLNSRSRERHISRPRQLAMYFSRKYTTNSIPEIGRNFGGKDQSTVTHSVKNIKKLMAKDPSFASKIQEIEANFE